MTTLSDLALTILTTADAAEKARLSREAAALWRAAPHMEIGQVCPPDHPARPEKPELLPPTEMPRRRGTSDKARAALLHAVQHIELNAIDLAWDMVARFTDEGFPRAFYDDWVQVGDEEGKHFLLLRDRVAELGYEYGDFPAHNGLWEAAHSTRDNIAARLAVVPMVLEARGLDVTPAMIERFGNLGDTASVSVLKVILSEEIGHVATGNRWFKFICQKQGREPKAYWQKMVRENFRGLLKPPFNEEARSAADFPPDYYVPLSAPQNAS
ncbi:ferritin-like domain-containing protein [Sneathiella chinensis]|uniref:Rhamnosyltransferase n=1 Tax=Sneathiella chinensis TaxID=349750 RepID=A0ABQ5U8A8_9PROT|nr:ferritin-like domain-containing protein [Sneathiella chinensis]GLQ07557.1 rhamnosyltransferase [Sneathiella chinensis]